MADLALQHCSTSMQSLSALLLCQSTCHPPHDTRLPTGSVIATPFVVLSTPFVLRFSGNQLARHLHLAPEVGKSQISLLARERVSILAAGGEETRTQALSVHVLLSLVVAVTKSVSIRVHHHTRRFGAPMPLGICKSHSENC